MTKLISDMYYKFKEAELGPSFCREKVGRIKKLVNSSTTFTVVGMPSIGISIFLRYLVTRPFAYFVHVDIYELPNLVRTELLRLLARQVGGRPGPKASYQDLLSLCKEKLAGLVRRHKRVAIVFNRFDQLKEQFDSSFFNNLRALRDVDKEKIVMIFSANKPLYDIDPEAISGGNLNMYSKTFYLTPYSNEDLKRLLLLNAPNLIPPGIRLEKFITLSGGHYQLLQLLLKSERLEHPLLDEFVRMQLKALYDYLSYRQRKQIRRIALGKSIAGSADEYSLNVGLVIKQGDRCKLFTPLLEELIASTQPFKLPDKENRLFNLLKGNQNKVVLKDEIFNVVWGENYVEASDWALNALVYRLRKNPVFVASGYEIENQKKMGYVLVRV